MHTKSSLAPTLPMLLPPKRVLELGFFAPDPDRFLPGTRVFVGKERAHCARLAREGRPGPKLLTNSVDLTRLGRINTPHASPRCAPGGFSFAQRAETVR